MFKAFAVTAAAALLVGLGGCDAEPPAPPLPSTATGPTTSAKPPVVLTAPTYRLGPMPVTPTWQPPGEEGRPQFTEGRWFIRYRTAGLELTVQRGAPEFGDMQPQTEHVPVQMLGFEGYRSTGVVGDSPHHTLYVVTTPDGLSVIVAGYDADIVRRYADGLRRQPMPMAPPFELALLPEQYAPSKVTSYSMEFVVTPEPTDPNAPLRYVGVMLWKGYEFDRPATAIAATVNGNAAEVLLDRSMASIRVMLPGGQVLVVEATPDVGLDQQDLERLAAGVTITADATAWTNEPR
jgi:hypothetical protein